MYVKKKEEEDDAEVDNKFSMIAYFVFFYFLCVSVVCPRPW